MIMFRGVVSALLIWQALGLTPSPTTSPTLSPSSAPTSTPNPSNSPSPTTSPTSVPTHKPTDVDFRDFGDLKAGSAQAALVQAIVFAVLLALAGVGMGVANYRHDQERAARKRKKITADQEMRESARENIRTEGGRTAEEVEEEVLKMLPLRDFDDEELDEQANEPSTLYQISMLVWLLLYPFRLLVFTVCCAVQRQQVKKAADIDEDGDDELADDEDDGDLMIDGFPIDCGTKKRKFLSMAKCKSATLSRHPHKTYDDKSGNSYSEPYMLFEEMGQHNMSEWPLPELKRKLGLIKDHGFVDKYGIGMSLYFKFLKTMTNVFFVASLIAIFPITYYYTGSSIPQSTRSEMLAAGSVQDLIYLTSSGSLLGQSFVCGSAFEGERVHLECASGTIQRVEAYFGTPSGSCSCPPKQQLVPNTGDCPAQPDYSRFDWGQCTETEDDDNDGEEGGGGGGPVAPCFKGQMWNGDGCCAYGVHPEDRWPDFSDLAMLPNPGCDSGSAQFIAQASCLGQRNCTLDITMNHTYQWEETAKAPCADGTLRNRECYASLDSPNANYTNCPKSIKDYRLVVRGVCDESEFQFHSPNGDWHSRADWALACSWCDAAITFILFCAVLWMAEKETAAVNIADLQFCSSDDYTLRVIHLPPPKKGMSPDLEKLKDAIKAHFSSHMAGLPPVIKERACRVVDVNLGMNNQETIKNMKKRGALARLLDLATDKLNLMAEFGTGTDKELQKQHDVVAVLKVKFLQVCELVKYKKKRLEAKTAFVTFDSEEGYERVRKAYSKRYGICGPPQAHYFRGEFLFQVTTAERPSDYIWENLSTPWIVRTGKVMLSNLVALGLLVVGFAIIIRAEDDKTKANLAAGATDCTPYSFGWSGFPEWDFRFTNGTSVLYDREDIVHNEYPERYNITNYATGLLGCYCSHVEEQAGETIARKVEFLNPNKDTYERWCGDYFDNVQASFVSSQFAVLIIIVVNEALKGCFASLVAFEGHETRTREILSLALKLFGAMLVNTALLTVLITGNLNLFFGGVVNPATRTLSSMALLAGNIGDFTPKWYSEVGAAIGATLLINAFALNATSFVAAAKIQLFRCLDRGCTLDMTRTKQKLQVQLETLYTGPAVKLEERYAALLVCFTACVIYSGGMPFLWVVGFISFLVALLADKWAFLRVYQLPPKIGPSLARVCTDQLPVPLFIHTLLSAWSFSAPTLFEYEPLTVVEGNVTAADYQQTYNGTRVSPWGHRKDFMPGEEYGHFDLVKELGRIVSHRNSVPHDIMILLWIVWFLATKVLELDAIFVWCTKICSKKEADLAEAGEEMDEQIRQSEVNKSRWAKVKAKTLIGTGSKAYFKKKPSSSDLQLNQPSAVPPTGVLSLDEVPEVSLDDGGEEEGGGGGDGGGGDADKKNADDDDGGAAAAEAVVEGGAPGEAQDDANPPAAAAAAADDDDEGGEEDRGGANDDAGDAEKKEEEKEPERALLGLRAEPGGFKGRAQSFRQKMGMSGDEEDNKPHHSRVFLDGASRQESLMDHEVAAMTDEFMNLSGGGIDAAKEKLALAHSSKKEQKAAKKALAVAKKAKKKATKNMTKEQLATYEAQHSGDHGTGDGSDDDEDALDDDEKRAREFERMRSFRESWLKVIEFVQHNRGRRLIEGNADFFWAIPTEELKKQIYQKVLHIGIREEFQKELDFRHLHPELDVQVTRKIIGLASYDFNCNVDYHEAFALDSTSLKMYQRGKIQVSGEDYELAHKGVLSWLKRQFFGMGSALDVVFPEINQDMNAAAERHTTAIGIDPTKIAGPRFVLNIRVPPPPPNLHVHDYKVKVTDMEDPNYDEWDENWQYLKLTIQDVFEYRVRLPKGLQFKKVPEVQIEIPAVEMTLSPVRTVLIGGERVIASAVDEDMMEGATALHDKQAHMEHSALDQFQTKTMSGVIDSDQAEAVDHGRETSSSGGKSGGAAAAAGDTGGASPKKPDHKTRKQKREEENIAKEDAAKRIQSAWMGKSARLHVSRMRSWQNRTLQFMEGTGMTCFAMVLVALDLTLSLGYSKEYPGPQEGIAAFATVFFTLELALRFFCYAYLSRGKGVDCADLDFFTSDYLRMVDLVTVVIDLVSTVVLLTASTGAGGSASRYLRSSKGARVVRVAKLVKVIRVARLSKITKLTNRDNMYQLTGKEPICMQRYHIKAPKEVEKGNRVEVMIPHLGKVQIQFPVYSKEDQPIQFHLPVCCKHHFGEIAPNCFLSKPTIDEAVEGGGQYSGVGGGRVQLGQHGWCQLWNPKDDDGLLDPPHHGGVLHHLLHNDKKGKQVTDKDGTKHREDNLERRERMYQDYYDDYTKHRVWYQVMAFAPKPVVKDFKDLSLFDHELVHFKDSVVMTLMPGELKGERIECMIRTDRGELHEQSKMIHVPGVGDVMTTLLASNEVTVPGLQGHQLAALGVLPWSSNASERKQLVPTVIGEVTFDFPAIMLPQVTEIISMKFSKAASVMGEGEGQAKVLASHMDKKKESAGRYLERECFTHVFQIQPVEFVKMAKVAQKKIKHDHLVAERKKKREAKIKSRLALRKHKEELKASELKAKEEKEKAKAVEAKANGTDVPPSSPGKESESKAESAKAEGGGSGGGDKKTGKKEKKEKKEKGVGCCAGKGVKDQVSEAAAAEQSTEMVPTKTTKADDDKATDLDAADSAQPAAASASAGGEEEEQNLDAAEAKVDGEKVEAKEEAAAADATTHDGGEAAAAEVEVVTEGGAPVAEGIDDLSSEEGLAEEGDEITAIATFYVTTTSTTKPGSKGENPMHPRRLTPPPKVRVKKNTAASTAGVDAGGGGGGAPGETQADDSPAAADTAAAAAAAGAPAGAGGSAKAKRKLARQESNPEVVAEHRKSLLQAANEEAEHNMEGVDLDDLALKAEEHQKITVARVGRFDVRWPEDDVEPFNISFPAIKPGKQLREEVLSLIEVPSDSQAGISPLARRYQFGWVLVLMHEKSPSGANIYLRLPAYVSHKQRALGTLDPNDFASPYSNRVHVQEGGSSGGSGGEGGAGSGEGGAGGLAKPPQSQEDAVGRAVAAERKVQELLKKIEVLEHKKEGGPSQPKKEAAAVAVVEAPSEGPAPTNYEEKGTAV